MQTIVFNFNQCGNESERTDCIAIITNQDFISYFDKKYMDNHIYKKIENFGLATLIDGFTRIDSDTKQGILILSTNLGHEEVADWMRSITNLVIEFYIESLN